MSRLGRRNGQTVASDIADFFRSNPDEEMTLQTIVAKFGCNPHTASNAVAELVKRGTVENLRVIRLRAKGIAC